MAITDALVLPADVLIVPVQELHPQVRDHAPGLPPHLQPDRVSRRPRVEVRGHACAAVTMNRSPSPPVSRVAGA